MYYVTISYIENRNKNFQKQTESFKDIRISIMKSKNKARIINT